MAKLNDSMADNLPGNQHIGESVAGDDAVPDPDRSADVYNDTSGYTPGVADPQAELGGKPVGRFVRVVGPALNPSMEPAKDEGDLSHENPVRCMSDYYEGDQMSYLAQPGHTFGVSYAGGVTLGQGYTNVGGRVVQTEEHAAPDVESARLKTTRPVNKPVLGDAHKP